MTTPGFDERSGRETRLLLLVVVVALACWCCWRASAFRRPSCRRGACAGPLAGLAARATFDDMAGVADRSAGAGGAGVTVVPLETIPEAKNASRQGARRQGGPSTPSPAFARAGAPDARAAAPSLISRSSTCRPDCRLAGERRRTTDRPSPPTPPAKSRSCGSPRRCRRDRWWRRSTASPGSATSPSSRRARRPERCGRCSSAASIRGRTRAGPSRRC